MPAGPMSRIGGFVRVCFFAALLFALIAGAYAVTAESALYRTPLSQMTLIDLSLALVIVPTVLIGGSMLWFFWAFNGSENHEMWASFAIVIASLFAIGSLLS